MRTLNINMKKKMYWNEDRRNLKESIFCYKDFFNNKNNESL